MDFFEYMDSENGYAFRNPDLLETALTHSSFSNGVGGRDRRQCNERLEFLGDSVLELISSRYLYMNLPKNTPEGTLTKLRSSLVCEKALCEYAEKISLGSALRLGKGEEQTGGRTRPSILADAFEAVIAAIYLDGEANGFNAAERFVKAFLPGTDELRKQRNPQGDYKTLLQEIIQQNPEERVAYELVSTAGALHSQVFTARVLLNGQVIGVGEGTSKKRAEQNAAREAVNLMGYKET